MRITTGYGSRPTGGSTLRQPILAGLRLAPLNTRTVTWYEWPAHNH